MHTSTCPPARPGTRLHFWHAAVLSAAAALAGHAGGALAQTAPPPAAANAAGDAPRIAPAPTSVGVWQDLGYFLAPWLAGDAPVAVAGPSAPTRVAGLRRSDGHWLVIVLAQVAPAGGAPCPAPTGLHLSDTDSGGCLRMRGDADFDHWLEQQHSALYQWLDERGWTSRPRAWVGYRVTTGERTIETHALIDPTLLEPATRNNMEFLAGSQPAQHWARRFAAATRASGDGALAVPPFPFAPRVAPPPEPASAAEPAAPAASAASAPTRAASAAARAAPAAPARAASAPTPAASAPTPAASAPTPAASAAARAAPAPAASAAAPAARPPRGGPSQPAAARPPAPRASQPK